MCTVQARGPDPEFDLEGRDSPKWGNHSIRRVADSAARQSMAETGASEEDIDLVFGWNEAVHASKMQHYYASRRDIVRRAAARRGYDPGIETRKPRRRARGGWDE